MILIFRFPPFHYSRVGCCVLFVKIKFSILLTWFEWKTDLLSFGVITQLEVIVSNCFEETATIEEMILDHGNYRNSVENAFVLGRDVKFMCKESKNENCFFFYKQHSKA